MTTSKLTVLLTLKGRPEFTLRWLRYANLVNLPFDIFIADGQPEMLVEQAMQSGQFRGLSIRYERYDDTDWAAFFFKCADAAAKIKTPYLMMSDNDDFLIPSGIQKSIDFLDHHPDYVSAGGAVPGFSVVGRNAPIRGTLASLSKAYGPNYRGSDVSEDRTFDRARHQISSRYRTAYYNVQRIESARTIFNEVAELNPIGFGLHETFCAVRSAIIGKVHFDDSYATYLRQRGTSAGAGKIDDLLEHLLFSEFLPSFNRIVDLLSRRIAVTGATADAAAMLRSEYLDGIRLSLARQHQRKGLFERIISRVPRLDRTAEIPEIETVKRVLSMDGQG